MTNEQIEKKFKFDMNMRRFITDDAGMFFFKTRDTLKYKNLFILLTNIGFRDGSDEAIKHFPNEYSTSYIWFSNEYNSYTTGHISVRTEAAFKYFNEIPDYLLEYTKLNMGCKL